MLTANQRTQIQVVLVRPRNPLNIGAAARAMTNFGLTALAVVEPWGPHWREARSAVGAPEVLARAMETPTLTQAVAGCTLVLGTGTLEYRKPEQRVLSLPAVGPEVAAQLAAGGRVAVVFGPEKHGLTREDLAACHALVEIPTDPTQPSMNLGQAVAVVLYELTVRTSPARPAERTEAASARSETLERLAELAGSVMEAAHYSPAVMREANRGDLRVLLRRLSLKEQDARRMMGFFRRVLWRLGRGDGGD